MYKESELGHLQKGRFWPLIYEYLINIKLSNFFNIKEQKSSFWIMENFVQTLKTRMVFQVLWQSLP